MNIHDLLKRYDKGQVTALHLMTIVINLVDESNADSILSALPAEVLAHVRDFATCYEPGPKISIGRVPDPGPERVKCIRLWFDASAT
ncbi:unnamed protein product [Tuwongella immobilis]|uniref:Uncharacterized protein n=1 Tax=Tuwongella immobilis TaxID=692036 RepID=A0A6C2YGX2_9BACT|nr:unnamed protein product [Tuwongella immobilis]VTR96958.1 unnamed protein product [Tuwongella immobilis]